MYASAASQAQEAAKRRAWSSCAPGIGKTGEQCTRCDSAVDGAECLQGHFGDSKIAYTVCLRCFDLVSNEPESKAATDFVFDLGVRAMSRELLRKEMEGQA